MNKNLAFKYPKLSDVLDSLESDTTSFDYAVSEGNESDDDEITFETHPFYSQVGDLRDLEIPDSDIY